MLYMNKTYSVSGLTLATKGHLWSENQLPGIIHGRFGQIPSQSYVSSC